jgi:hypothetical protein
VAVSVIAHSLLAALSLDLVVLAAPNWAVHVLSLHTETINPERILSTRKEMEFPHMPAAFAPRESAAPSSFESPRGGRSRCVDQGSPLPPAYGLDDFDFACPGPLGAAAASVEFETGVHRGHIMASRFGCCRPWQVERCGGSTS